MRREEFNLPNPDKNQIKLSDLLSEEEMLKIRKEGFKKGLCKLIDECTKEEFDDIVSSLFKQ